MGSHCIRRNCPECGDLLIHQSNRGHNESSSAFGQHVHDDLGKEFFFADIDGAVFKRRHKLLRVIEHKPRSGGPSKGQMSILPLLAVGVRVLTVVGTLHIESGVFIVNSDAPYESGRVIRIGRSGPQNDLEMSGDLFEAFKTGEPLGPFLAAGGRRAA